MIPKDLPKEMIGLWKIQYEKREKELLSKLNADEKKIYLKYKWHEKVGVIDYFHSRGLI